MPRIARLIAPGYPHHIVQRGNNRKAVFFEERDRVCYLSFLQRFKKEISCLLHAYCLMSNHVHLLITPGKAHSLAKIMQKVSLCYTQYINKKYGRTGRLWECRFHSSIIDRDEYFWAVCRYIERNPVRANMVSNPDAYRWSSAGIHSSQGSNTLVGVLWQDKEGQKSYNDFINTQETADERRRITTALYRGNPLGGSAFLEQLQERFGIRINLRPRGRPKKKTK